MTRKAKVAIAGVLIAVTAVGASYFALRPKWARATREEIDKIIDPALRTSKPDPAALDRYARLSAVIRELRNNDSFQSHDAHNPSEATDHYRASTAPYQAKIRTILEEGPCLRPIADRDKDVEGALYENDFINILISVAADSSGPVRERVQAIHLAILVLHRMFEASHTTSEAVGVLAKESFLYELTATRFGIKKLPTPQLEKLLAGIPEIDKSTNLSQAIIGEFQAEIYPYLLDPMGSVERRAKRLEELSKTYDIDSDFVDPGPGVGNFDARYMAKLLSDITMEQFRNSARPAQSQETPLLDSFQTMNLKLPVNMAGFKDGIYAWCEGQTYRYQMNRFPNSYGYATAPLIDARLLESLRQRDIANCRLLRIQLACLIYLNREGHLPKNLSKLIQMKILDVVPLDPFTHKSFHYDPQRKLLWSIGHDGNDDHGSEANRSGWSVDMVVHLK